MDNPLITVFTSCYNQAEFLNEAIKSVLYQTHRDFEYLLFDDGSTDDTSKIITDNWRQDERVVQYGASKAKNVGCLLNRAIKDMKGDFFVWCPADDILDKDLLEKKLELSKQLNHQCVVYSNFMLLENGTKTDVLLPSKSPRDFAKRIRTECPIGMTGIWIPKTIFDKVGLFPEHLDYCEDYWWVCKAVSLGIKFVNIGSIMYTKRIHRNRTSKRYSQHQIVERTNQIRKEFFGDS